MTRVTCRLTDKNRDWLRNPTLDGLSCRKSNSHLRSGRDTDKTVLSCLAWRCELPLRRSRNNPAGYVAAAVAINTNLSLLTLQLDALITRPLQPVISCSAANQPLLLSIDGTDRRTDGRSSVAWTLSRIVGLCSQRQQ